MRRSSPIAPSAESSPTDIEELRLELATAMTAGSGWWKRPTQRAKHQRYEPEEDPPRAPLYPHVVPRPSALLRYGSPGASRIQNQGHGQLALVRIKHPWGRLEGLTRSQVAGRRFGGRDRGNCLRRRGRLFAAHGAGSGCGRSRDQHGTRSGDAADRPAQRTPGGLHRRQLPGRVPEHPRGRSLRCRDPERHQGAEPRHSGVGAAALPHGRPPGRRPRGGGPALRNRCQHRRAPRGAGRDRRHLHLGAGVRAAARHLRDRLRGSRRKDRQEHPEPRPCLPHRRGRGGRGRGGHQGRAASLAPPAAGKRRPCC